MQKKMNKKVLGLLGTGHAVTDINQGALPMMLAYLQPVFALSQMQVGVVMLFFNLSSSIIQPLFGVLSDRVKVAWLIPAGCLVAGGGMALTGFAPNYHVLLLIALVSGLGVAAYHPEGSKYARFASGPRKASGMSWFSVGGNVGFAAGPVLTGLFVGLAGLHGSVGFLVISGAMAFLLWSHLQEITTTESGTVHQTRVVPPGPVEPAARTRKVPATRTPLPALTTGQLIFPVVILVLVVIMRSWVHFGLVTFLPQYYVGYLGQTEKYAAVLTSLFLFAGAIGTVAGGPAADRFGLKNILLGSMALLVPLLFLFNRLSDIWLPVVVALMGFTLISTFAVTVVFSQELLPNNVGLASGLTLGFAVGMGGVGAMVLGWVADHWGMPMVFQVMMAFPAIALLLTLALPGKEALQKRKKAVRATW